jgi:hypothetical protein
MSFRATNFTVTVLLLMALTVFMIVLRNRKSLDNVWPLFYWFLAFLFTLVREEDTYNLNIILVGLVSGLLLKYEFMNAFFVRLIKMMELCIFGYVIYRGFQIIVY